MCLRVSVSVQRGNRMICVVKPSANSDSKVKIQANLTNIQLAALPGCRRDAGRFKAIPETNENVNKNAIRVRVLVNVSCNKNIVPTQIKSDQLGRFNTQWRIFGIPSY